MKIVTKCKHVSGQRICIGRKFIENQQLTQTFESTPTAPGSTDCANCKNCRHFPSGGLLRQSRAGSRQRGQACGATLNGIAPYLNRCRCRPDHRQQVKWPPYSRPVFPWALVSQARQLSFARSWKSGFQVEGIENGLQLTSSLCFGWISLQSTGRYWISASELLLFI